MFKNHNLENSTGGRSSVVYVHQLLVVSRCGRYQQYLTAADLIELLHVSRPTAYRMIESRKLTDVQRELLELKLFGLIPGWGGWRIVPGAIVDPSGYKYTVEDIQMIPHLKSICDTSRLI